MCRRDWYLVPYALRSRIWATWRSGEAAFSSKHQAVVHEAIAHAQAARYAVDEGLLRIDRRSGQGAGRAQGEMSLAGDLDSGALRERIRATRGVSGRVETEGLPVSLQRLR
jgi:hypothetical protein